MKICLKSGSILLVDPEAVFFDKDGTLIDIHHYWGAMIKIRADLVCRRLYRNDGSRATIRNQLIEAMGLEIETEKLNRQGPIGVKPRSAIVDIVGKTLRTGGHQLSDSSIEEIFVEVDSITAKDLSQFLKLLPGVRKLLISLRRTEVPAFVLTTDLTSRAKMAMESLNIDSYFEAIFGGDSVANTKPAPDLVERAVQHGRYNIDRVAVIGDHQVDIQMGINAGVQVNVGVTTGLSNKDDFRALPCQLVEDLTEIEIRN